MQVHSLPPSVTVGATIVDVTVLTDEGATVVVNLPRPKGLHDISDAELTHRAREMARQAMIEAAQSLAR
jgi:hypothetical protein